MLEDRKEELNEEYNMFVKDNIGEDEDAETGVAPGGGRDGVVQFSEDGLQQTMILKEMMDLESKVIWELENWKKAEEAKFKYDLKQREIEYLEKLQKERQQKEIEREIIFKEHEARLKSLNKKMQIKLNKLMQRENKLVLLEEELKQRINETSRQMAAKDEETEKEKIKMVDSKKSLHRKINSLEKKLKNVENNYEELKDEYVAYRREQETSPVQLIKNELNSKLLEIDELKKQLDKSKEIKNEYRKHFERLKEEIMRLKKEKSELKARTSKEKHQDLNLIKEHIAMITKLNDNAQIKNLRNDLNRLKGGNDLQTSEFQDYLNSKKNKTGQLEISEVRNKERQGRISQANIKRSNLLRLKAEKEQFLIQGYTEDDPLILHLNKAIKLNEEDN